MRPPTLRRPRREAELLTQLQQLAVALDGACPLVLDGSCGSHVTPSALLAPGELDAAASTTGLLAVSEWSCVPVGGWLRSLGLAQYADAFVARSVDGARLLGLTEQAMEDEPDVGLDVATSKPACWVSASRHSPADLSASWTASVPHS
ncbi:uncharacterized protein LOC122388913 [Amphibalanus amphitrite]|uniref:uncharacterized protein LOC122388913 n=1 Tax=Amphibalanus amphitrite TaxID=1232801 RepID=UPI001C918732|nr:uncharacterized protein LOC122388913 [Amphibalanus amphitrite]